MGIKLPKGVSAQNIDHSTYQRVIVETEDSLKNRDMTHQFAPTINMATGDLWIDCSTAKLRHKFMWLSLARPIHTAIKTLYHASGISSAYEVSKYFRRDKKGKRLQDGKTTFRNIGRCIADLVRTPAYGLAMEVMHVVGALSTIVKPNTAYRIREISGKLENRLNRGIYKWTNHPFRYLAPCLIPEYNIGDIAKRRRKAVRTWKDTHKRGYKNLSNEAIALKTWAKGFANHQRDHADIAFSCQFRPLGREVAYISPILQQHPEALAK